MSAGGSAGWHYKHARMKADHPRALKRQITSRLPAVPSLIDLVYCGLRLQDSAGKWQGCRWLGLAIWEPLRVLLR